MNNPYLETYRQQMLRQAQLKMLHILEVIDAICKKYNINYWIDAGTLLGAVRHGGFIPWDDDLDISMMRKDYKRFLKVAAKELPEDMFLQTRKTDRRWHAHGCKVRDLNSFVVETEDYNARGYQKGIFVDIFPYGKGPRVMHRFMGKVARAICIADTVLHRPHTYSWVNTASLFYFGIKRGVCRAVWRGVCFVTGSKRFIAIKPCYNWYRAIHPAGNIFPLSEVEFEGKKFPAPAKPDEYLKTLYGNWRVIPPKEKQQVHSTIIVPELIDMHEGE